MTRQLLFLTTVFAAAGVAASPTFDVASVKIGKAPDAAVLISGGMMDTANGRFRVPGIGGNVSLMNWTLGMCITAAWDLGPGQMSGPAWLNGERYDIAAKTSPLATQAELRLMLQSLLAERFRLVTHRETREMAAYALVVVKNAKNGPRLKPAVAELRLPVLFAPPSRLIGQGSTVQGLALALSRSAGRKVVDQTGINGAFDFTLSYSADDGADGAPSIFTALQEQLGLKLEPSKASAEVLVVDHAEKIPTEN